MNEKSKTIVRSIALALNILALLALVYFHASGELRYSPIFIKFALYGFVIFNILGLREIPNKELAQLKLEAEKAALQYKIAQYKSGTMDPANPDKKSCCKE